MKNRKTKIILIGLVLLAILFLPKLPVQAASNDILVYYTNSPMNPYCNADIFTDDLENLGYNITVKHRADKNELGLTAASTINLLDYGQVWIINMDEYSKPFQSSEISAIKTFRDSPHKGGLLLSVDHDPYYQSAVNPITKQFNNNNTELFFGNNSRNSGKCCVSPSFTSPKHPLYSEIDMLSSSDSDAEFNIQNSNIEVTARYNNKIYGAALDEQGKGRIVFDSSTVRFFNFDDSHYDLCSDSEESQYQQNIAQWLGKISFPPSCLITPSSTSISSGESVAITWSSKNADRVVKSNFGITNPNDISGQKTFFPNKKTTYQLTVANEEGKQAYCETIITVQKPLPVIKGPCQNLVPCGTSKNPERCALHHIFVMIKNIVNCLVFISTIICLLFLVIGGLLYIFSLGNPENLTKAKNTILWALGGLALVFLAWLIVNTVMYWMGVDNSFLMWSSVG